MKKNVISMSLYGNDKKYSDGVKHNAVLAKKHFPEWEFRVYVDNNLSDNIKKELESLNVNLINIKDDSMGMFWRFFVYDDTSVDNFIIRDSDDRLNSYDKLIVDEWISSGLPFHIIRSHHGHHTEIMGGLWGGKSNFFEGFSITDSIKNYRDKFCSKGCDQFFLRDIIWPKIKNISLVHGFDPYGSPNRKDFPKTVCCYQGKTFYPVGEVYENNVINSIYE